MSLRDKIEQALKTTELGLALQRGSNKDGFLWPIFYWQTVNDIASKTAKHAWDDGFIAQAVPTEDAMRKLGVGEHCVADTNHFSVLASVRSPAMLFDRDLFIEKVARVYKLDRMKLAALAEKCRTESKPALSKRVVEAAQ